MGPINFLKKSNNFTNEVIKCSGRFRLHCRDKNSENFQCIIMFSSNKIVIFLSRGSCLESIIETNTEREIML